MHLDQLKQLTDKLNDRDREREVLIQELQFRLKDSLQTVTSLLAMVARDSDNAEATDIINSTIYRVQGMALVYGMSCKSDDVSNVDIQQVVNKILSNALQIHPCPECSVDIDVQDLSLPLHTAMPVAQIINELLIDAFREAAKVGGTVHLTLNNSGISVEPVGKDIHDTLGVYLVKILTEQLGGTIVISGETFNIQIDLYNMSEVKKRGTNTNC